MQTVRTAFVCAGFVGGSMKRSLGLFCLLLLCTLATAFPANSPAGSSSSEVCAVPGTSWEMLSRQDSGWSAEKLALARQYFDSIHSAAVVIVQDGKVVQQWGDVSKKLTTFSVRKSLISALYGVYSARGAIDVNATLAQLGIQDSPDPLTPAEQQARVVDLLRARSGVYHAASFEIDFQKKMRPARGSHAPGTFWFYNNWDYNALGTILEQQAKKPMGTAFAQEIAGPTGMQDFRADDVYYIGGPESIHRAFMFQMSARDMARFGQLYLCHGRWGGKQIVPAGWVEKSSHAQQMVSVGKMQLGGYEYLWWVEHGGKLLDDGTTLPGMFAAEGAGGHYILVVPSRNMVIAYQFDNEPKEKSTAAVLAATPLGINDEQFSHLVKLILDAKTTPAT
jgi:CubicO group peptidase (beta-lactamase class C family)